MTLRIYVVQVGNQPLSILESGFLHDEGIEGMWITVHFYPNETYQSVIEEIENHLQCIAMADPWLREHPLHFKWGGKSMIEERGEIFPALELSRDHQAIQLLEQVHQQVMAAPAVVGMSKNGYRCRLVRGSRNSNSHIWSR